MTENGSSEPVAKVRPFVPGDRDAAVSLLAGYRVALSALRGPERTPDEGAAALELQEYLGRGFPVFVAEADGRPIGLLVCRVDGPTVWAECLYVAPEWWRHGVGTALYAAAEELAAARGEPTVYTWVHPDNRAVIRLLASRGYDVLNLIEVRRALPGETPRATLRIGEHDYRY